MGKKLNKKSKIILLEWAWVTWDISNLNLTPMNSTPKEIWVTRDIYNLNLIVPTNSIQKEICTPRALQNSNYNKNTWWSPHEVVETPWLPRVANKI